MSLALISCNSEYGKYDGESVVYLTSYDSPRDTTNLSFTYINSDSMYVPIYIQLKTIGRITNYDREIKFNINLHNCVEGVDIDPIERIQILPAGSFIKTLTINLRRSEAIKLVEKTFEIELAESKDFKLLYNQYYAERDTLSALKHTFKFSEFMNNPPITWSEGHFGKFSAKKFTTMCDELNISREKFLDKFYMTTGRKNYMKKEMTRILQVAKDAGTPFYEVDGVTEMVMGK